MSFLKEIVEKIGEALDLGAKILQALAPAVDPAHKWDS